MVSVYILRFLYQMWLLLLLFIICRYKRNIDILVQVMIDSKSSVLSLLFLLFLFLFLTAVIGMQLFGGR